MHTEMNSIWVLMFRNEGEDNTFPVCAFSDHKDAERALTIRIDRKRKASAKEDYWLEDVRLDDIRDILIQGDKMKDASNG